MPPLLRELLRPRRGTIAVILAAMLVQTVDEPGRALAAEGRPRQRGRKPPAAAVDRVAAYRYWAGRARATIAAAAGIATVLIAVVTGAAMYVSRVTSPRAWVSASETTCACGLYHHLQELSLAYLRHHEDRHDHVHPDGDVQTIQSFASMSTLKSSPTR